MNPDRLLPKGSAMTLHIVAEAQNLRRAGEEFANEKLGTLTVAT